MKKPIDKGFFLNALECRTLGWFLRSDDDSGEPTLADGFRMEQGSLIGGLARALYPAASFISPGPGAARRTKSIMTDASVRVLFEATFVAGKSTAKADIAVRSKRAWKIIEVKPSLRDTNRIDELVADLTYTVVAARRAGVMVTEASLVLLSRDFRKGMPTTERFVEVDQTESVNELAFEFDLAWDEVERTTATPTKPAPNLIRACEGCVYFATECHGTNVTHPVFEIPRLSEKKLAELAKLGILEITDLPGRFKLTETQRRVVDAVRTGRTFVGALRAGIERVEWPAYYPARISHRFAG